MRVVIIGAGGVGSAIADALSSEAKDVVAIDKNEEHVRAIRSAFDVQAMHGSGSNPAILRDRGAAKEELGDDAGASADAESAAELDPE